MRVEEKRRRLEALKCLDAATDWLGAREVAAQIFPNASDARAAISNAGYTLRCLWEDGYAERKNLHNTDQVVAGNRKKIAPRVVYQITAEGREYLAKQTR